MGTPEGNCDHARRETRGARCGVIPREKVVALMQSQGVTRALWEYDEARVSSRRPSGDDARLPGVKVPP